MKITVTAEKPQDNKMAVKLTVAKEDVNRAIKGAYSDIAKKYNFQGFRKGRAPRPMIDAVVGRDAVLNQATFDLLDNAEPVMLEQLDVVPMGKVDYGEEAKLLVEGTDYELDITIPVRPECELDSYDAPAINMPPAEVTDAEIEQQIEQLLSYRTSYEDVEEDRAVEKGDIVSVNIEDVENAKHLAGENHLLAMDGNGLPAEVDEGLTGMSKGETKEISWTSTHKHGDHEHEVKSTIKVTLNAIKKAVVPELTDELAKDGFGFDDVAALRDAVKCEIESDKKNSLPALKEDRLVEALASHLTLEETPKEYVDQVYTETAQNFLGQLQSQGMTLDGFLAMRGIKPEEFFDDLRAQSEERARQSLALDALAAHLGLTADDADIAKEFEDAGAKDVEKVVKQWKDAGRLPAIRESVKRTKALSWLVDNAQVTEVDEVAEARANKDADAE